MTNKSANKAGSNLKGDPAKRKDKRNNNNKDSGSDVLNSDIEQTNNKNNPSKCTRTLSENSIEEDFITDSAADAGGSNTTPPQQNNTDNFSQRYCCAFCTWFCHVWRDYQAAAVPNASPEFVKKYPTNRALIDAVNNLLLETYHSYTGCAHISGSSDSKRLVIHFNSTKERDACFSL
ncbi:hypothetical protein RhiirC2_797251 [Rhizophagus irregularis]|uniref:Uncharacterized protein n=1 Tax=Rhizophagus irregularis TaxID=588596 RepID=A0A2N1M8D2_9GLOM|nr:hypothetical protein RhiirC2_797251 [Rhizophagus irregularis]